MNVTNETVETIKTYLLFSIFFSDNGAL